MAIIPLFRVIIFSLVTLLALVVLGICAHIEFLISGYTDVYTSFVPFGIGISSLTIVSLPLFLVLGNLRHRVFTSTILFEIVWFFLLWVLWVGSAGDTVAGKAYSYPDGCIYDYYPDANRVCYEITVIEAFAFANFFLAFIYYDVIFLYAIINAIRGRGVWITSVKEATTGGPGTVNAGVLMTQPQSNAAPGVPYQSYHPTDVPAGQPGPYSPYSQQVPPQSIPAQPYPPQFTPQGFPSQAYPQQVPPQGLPQQYSAYPSQPQIDSKQPYTTYPNQLIQSDPSQPYSYIPSSGSPPQQVNYLGYSPGSPSLPPPVNYSAHPVSGAQPQLPLPSGYQVQPVPAEPLPSPYGE